MDITAVQIVRYTLFYSGGEKHERGIGFGIKDNVLPNVVKFKPISDRICYVEVKCR